MIGFGELCDEVKSLTLRVWPVVSRRISPQPLIYDEERHVRLFVYGEERSYVLQFSFHEGGEPARNLTVTRNELTIECGLFSLASHVVTAQLLRLQQPFLNARQNRQKELFTMRCED